MRHKQCALFFVLIITLFFTACKSDNDVMATFKGGKITRKDFYDWLDVKKYNRETILKKKKSQQDKLDFMALEKIAVIEAKKVSYDKNKDFIGIRSLSLDNMLVSSFMKEVIIENPDKKNPVIKVNHIFLSLRNKPNKKDKIKKSKEEIKKSKEKLAKTIIDSLQKGTSFAKLAKQYSEDFTRHKGGEVGYIVKGMRSQEYSDMAFSLEEGEYTKKPVVDNHGVYVIQVIEKDEVTLDNLDDVIKDKKSASRIKSFLKRNNATTYLKQLRESKDVAFNDDNVSKKKGKSVIYTVADKNFSCDDLNAIIGLYSRRQQPTGGKPIELNRKQRFQFAKKLYELELIKKDAFQQKYQESENYKKMHRVAEDMILAREYMNFLKTNNIDITMKDMREEYAKNKDRLYMRRKKGSRGKKSVKEIIPFAEAKKRIKNKLFAEKRSKIIKNWEGEMKKKYTLAIHTSALVGA